MFLLLFVVCLLFPHHTNTQTDEVVITSVSGCTDSTPPLTTTKCPLQGGMTLTIHGDSFSPQFKYEVHIGNELCPDLINQEGKRLLCTLPKGKLGQTAAVSVTRLPGKDTCDHGWSRYNDVCYRVFGTDLRDWNSAEQGCVTAGGHLATAGDADINQFITDQFSTSPSNLAHIGLHDQGSQLQFKWTSTKPYLWKNWQPTFPNQARVSHCACIHKSGQWQDTNCANRLPYICEITLMSTTQGSTVVLEEGVKYRQQLKLANIDFEELGIGGLQKQMDEILRRTFSSRVQEQDTLTKLGIRHVKGLMLHGPPGTGKTLVARKIGALLQAKKVTVVNGPEIMNKYVGQSEANMRALFEESLADWDRWGQDAGLYVIVFDEIDAIMRPRGSKTDDSVARAVYDGVTTQLLSIMDGHSSNNNVLVIGLTNRIELIDPALLRPGRFEVKIQMPLPDFEGRLSILRIHTKHVRESNLMNDDVDLEQISRATNTYTGADLEGIVKSAISFALAEPLEKMRLDAQEEEGDETEDEENAEEDDEQQYEEEEDDEPVPIRITQAHFDRALNEVEPTLGNKNYLQRYFKKGIMEYSAAFVEVRDELNLLVDTVKTSDTLNYLRILLYGDEGSGTTALTSHLAHTLNWPFTHVIHIDQFMDMNDATRIEKITKVFEDAYKVSLGIIVIDKVEAVMDYNAMGTRISTSILNCILTLLNKQPPPADHGEETKLVVILTTAVKDALSMFGMDHYWDIQLHMPSLSRIDSAKLLQKMQIVNNAADAEEIVAVLPPKVGIKKLLFSMDMAWALSKIPQGQPVPKEKILTTLEQVGLHNKTQVGMFSMYGTTL